MSDKQRRPRPKPHRNLGRSWGNGRANQTSRNHDIWIPSQHDRSPPRRSIFLEPEKPTAGSMFNHPDREAIIIKRRVSHNISNSHSRSRSQSPVRKVQVVYVVSDGEIDHMKIRGVYKQRDRAQKKADDLMIDDEDTTREWNTRGSDCWSSNGDHVEIRLWEVE